MHIFSMDNAANSWQAVGSYFGRRPVLGFGLTIGAVIAAWGYTHPLSGSGPTVVEVRPYEAPTIAAQPPFNQDTFETSANPH
jgi:hypothetical protein